MNKKIKDLTEDELRQIIREENRISLENFFNTGSVIISQPDEPFIDVDDAAEYIKLGKSSIYKKIMNSTIPFHKKPGSNRVLFKKSELSEWLKTNDKESQK